MSLSTGVYLFLAIAFAAGLAINWAQRRELRRRARDALAQQE